MLKKLQGGLFMLPLEGVKILDLTRVLAGPYATMILADMGADVIKIEIPKTGDDSRAFGPFLKGESAYFMSINRNKRSMTLNLKTEEGKEILTKLIKKADVIVENYRPGTMEKLGFGYEKIKDINDKIIYAACSGFGHSGPYTKKPAYDAIVQAMGGIMSITGQENGEPTRVGASIGDIIAGIFTATGILTALYHREKTGKGQKVDVAMLDCQVAILENAIARYFVSGEIPKPIGNRHPSITPFEAFDTKDGKIMIAIGNDRLWAKFCTMVGREELIEDERFASNALRTQNYAETKQIVSEILANETADYWLEKFDEENIPATRINTIDKVVSNPQVLARDMIISVDHPVAGDFKMAGIPIKLSETPGTVRRPAPTLGEHTEDILENMFGYSKEEIEKLREKGVI